MKKKLSPKQQALKDMKLEGIPSFISRQQLVLKQPILTKRLGLLGL